MILRVVSCWREAARGASSWVLGSRSSASIMECLVRRRRRCELSTKCVELGFEQELRACISLRRRLDPVAPNTESMIA
jgi:hypothetical protein